MHGINLEKGTNNCNHNSEGKCTKIDKPCELTIVECYGCSLFEPYTNAFPNTFQELRNKVEKLEKENLKIMEDFTATCEEVANEYSRGYREAVSGFENSCKNCKEESKKLFEENCKLKLEIDSLEQLCEERYSEGLNDGRNQMEDWNNGSDIYYEDLEGKED